MNPTNSPHIKIEASLETQEIVLPSIVSESVVIIKVGSMSLSNGVRVAKGVSEEGQLPPVLNEEYHTKLASIELYRCDVLHCQNTNYYYILLLYYYYYMYMHFHFKVY